MAWHTQSTRHTVARLSGAPKVKPKVKPNCKHLDGWILPYNSIVINEQFNNEEYEEDFECNTAGCNKIKRFKFDIKNIEEVDTVD